ncbi:glutamate--tRNA ligase [Sulfobacillus harzensis]|uniref:Glutamate--tRNA ligase n=1 Tax=Sulfobacillus harzensis TaxID=2729629 RepID=A0A7Y0L5X3_9FIRM|nr:glutamate--tRNA ligase [Sulfobacillus harzensis]NMP23638.1 glutamate--tRNA ligase [Sulfobacillus harzensis]
MHVVRVRYAPSPTGTLHIGGARTALFNFLFARHTNGTFVLRVEDTDQARQVPGSEEAMIRGLKSLGILWDEGPDTPSQPYGPYRVTERMARHQELARQLLAEGKAYRCFCTPEELEAERNRRRAEGLPPRYSGRCRTLTPEASKARAEAGERWVLRLVVPEEGETIVEDIIRGTVRFENRILDDFVLMKPDFTPVYNFAVAIDDHDMAITHVIRGEEHLSNTPKQILVMKALGFDLPKFAHLPMILAPDRTKLSKRHGATSVEEYRDQGILPEALVNYLLLLGWSAPDGREIMTLDEAAQEFTLERVQHTAAIYDQKKLEWMNHEYFVRLPVERIVEAVQPFITYDTSQGPDFHAVVALSRERSFTLVQLAESMRFFYERPSTYESKGVQKHFGGHVVERLEALVERLEQLTAWDHDILLSAYDTLSGELSIKRAELIHPTRLAVTGRTVGPGLFELVALLGRDETLARLRTSAELIRSDRVPVEA